MPGLNLFAGAHETALFGLSVNNIAPPYPTTAPSLYPNALGIRQAVSDADASDGTLETCAWFSHTVSDKGWEALDCPEPCTMRASIFGCEVVPTTCFDYTIQACQATLPGDWCCDSGFPHCITAVLDEDGEAFTAFRCAKGALTGEVSLYSETTAETTGTTVVSDGDSTSTVAVVETETETPDEDSTPSNHDPVPEDDNNQNEDSNNGNSGGGSSAPIGAIVGGVIGGVALLLVAGFIIWFIRFQKKKQTYNPTGNGTETQEHDPSAPGYAGGYLQQQGGYGYTQVGYNNGQYGMAEMPADSKYGAPTELPSEGTTMHEKP